MTKNLPPRNPPLIKEELDVDSFLRRHSTRVSGHSSDSSSSSDDEHSQVNPHRTVDDILNDSDSSSSDNDAVSVRTKTLNSASKSSSSTQYKYNLIQRFKSDDYSSRKPPAPPNLRHSSMFGGGVRSAGKPGDALAAAAAASRSIKSRRAMSLSLVGKVSDGDELYDVSDNISTVSGGIDLSSESNYGDHNNNNNFNVYEDVGEVIREREKDDLKSVDQLEIGEPESVLQSLGSSVSHSNVETGYKVDESGKENSDVILDVKTGNEVDESGIEKSSVIPDIEIANEVNDSESGNGKSLISVSEDIETRNEVDESGKEESAIAFLDVVMKTDNEHFADTEDCIGRDDTGSGSDEERGLVEELVEDRMQELESERESKMAEEKSRPKKKPLELAEELEKKQASTGQDWEEGAAAQPMRLEGVRRGSTVLGYFDINADNAISRTIKSQVFRRDYGIPHVMAVHLNYIALGMSKGVIVVVPSKYSAHQSDTMDSKMLMLGAQGDRSQVPVTSICFNQQGDLLLAGYGDGHITFWSLPKGTVTKVVTGEHKAPVVHALFLGQDSQVTRQYKAVTGDCKGLLLLHEISVMTLFGFQIKTQCLLDGQKTGTVLCAAPLLPDDCTGVIPGTVPGNTTGSTSSIGGVMGGVVGGAGGWKLFTEGSSLSEEGET